MAKARSIDWDSFMRGYITPMRSKQRNAAIAEGLLIGMSMVAVYDVNRMVSAEEAVPAMASDAVPAFSGDTSWADYLIPMLEHQGLPLAIVMGTWACLEMIINRPASAIERVKWAVLGYLALQFVPRFITGIGHRG